VGESAFDWWLFQAAGPVVGTARGFARSLQDLNRVGYDPQAWQRVLEGTLPAPFRNAIKAGRYAENGVTTRRGDLVVEDISLPELGWQAVGFAPLRLAEQYRANTFNYEEKTALERRRKSIVDRYIAAVLWQDEDLINETLDFVTRFNEKNPEIAIKSDTLSSAYRNFVKARAQAENGVFIPSKGMRARLKRDDEVGEDEE
jgi:hypothetical protein